MAKLVSKRTLKWIIPALAVVAIAFLGLRYWKARKSALPEGIVSGNGRIEAKLVDVAAKESLRVQKVMVDEGAMVKPDQVVVQMDTTTLRSELAEANAGIAAAEERVAVAKASIVRSKSEIALAKVELERSRRLVAQGAGARRELDVRKTKVETSQAALAEAQATLQTAEQQVEVARATAKTVQTRIEDATLRSPITGRV